MIDSAVSIDPMLALDQTRQVPNPAKASTLAKARKVAENFEAFFLGQMLQPLFEGLETEAPFGGGHAEQVWRSMLVDEYGKQIARSGGIGIADAVMRQMIQLQEGRAQ